MAKQKHITLRPSLSRVSRIHLFIAILLAVQLIIYDAGKLVTPEIVLKRWIGIGILAIVSAIALFLSQISSSDSTLKKTLWVLICTDIALASWSIYLERGMASRAVFLYVIPIISSAILLRKSAIYLTGLLSAVAYILTTNAYFVNYFNEGYKLELYGEVLGYSALLLFVSALTWSVIKSKKHF